LLEEPAMAPASAVRFAADQLAITGSAARRASAARWNDAPATANVQALGATKGYRRIDG
jgi:hypothetical protein